MLVRTLGLEDDEEAALIELMVSAVIQVDQGTPPTSRSNRKKVRREEGFQDTEGEEWGEVFLNSVKCLRFSRTGEFCPQSFQGC